LINSIPKKADPDIKVEIDPDLWQEEKTYKKHFKDFECIICLSVVWNPAACVKCHKNFCGKCINTHLEKHKKCPACRRKFIKEIAQMNRTLLCQLEDFEFDCQECKKPYKYKDAESH